MPPSCWMLVDVPVWTDAESLSVKLTRTVTGRTTRSVLLVASIVAYTSGWRGVYDSTVHFCTHSTYSTHTQVCTPATYTSVCTHMNCLRKEIPYIIHHQHIWCVFQHILRQIQYIYAHTSKENVSYKLACIQSKPVPGINNIYWHKQRQIFRCCSSRAVEQSFTSSETNWH